MISLDGNSLTLEQLVAIAHDHAQIRLTADARGRVLAARAVVEEFADHETPAYGINTGFGNFADVRIPHAQLSELQVNLLRSHAAGVGERLPVPVVRAAMALRANVLAKGYSGIRLETLDLLVELLNRRIHPLVPSRGSVGASGDLAPLAHMALPMIGEGEVEHAGRVQGAKAALAAVGLKPLTLVAKEGLALTNGTSVMCALGVLETLRAENLSQCADIGGALSLEALHGTPAAFDERLHRLRPFPRQIECAAYLRALLEGSGFVRDNARNSGDVQDAYTLRCIPQVHGAARDAIAYARWVFEIELNAVTDNPLLFVDEKSGAVEVVSGGNFHGEPLAIAMDYLGIAVAELGNISERRTMRLTDQASNTHVLPAFLTREGGLNSGFMITQYTAAALATENKVLAHPASVDTIPTSANVEDHVSMGVTAGLKLRQILDNVEGILAIELMAAAQGIDFRKADVGAGARLGRGTAAAYAAVRMRVPFIERDTVMYGYLDAVRRDVHDGILAAAVRSALGA